MSNDLAVPQLTEGQASPEVTTNDATAWLAAAIANKFTADLSSGNVSVTASQYRQAVLVYASGVATTGRTVTLPQVEREFALVESDSANSDTIQLIRGSTSIKLWPGRVYLVRTDGTANGLAVKDIGGSVAPADFAAFVPGVLSNAQVMLRFTATREFTLPTSLTGSYFKAGANATADTTLTVKKNGASIGTILFGTGTASGTSTFASPVSFLPGDLVTVHNQGTADATLADVNLSFAGSR